MSTRATYHFKATDYSPAVTIYKHHDGYPSGGASALALAVAANMGGGGGLAEGFLRGNKESELTESHEVHGDTEYRYDVTAVKARQWVIRVTKRDHPLGVLGREKWTAIFAGTLADFLEQHKVEEKR